jgi:abortive infection bacteriophage resistance protein
MAKFTDPHTSIASQIAALEAKKLTIGDKGHASKILSTVSFFRLKQYGYLLQDADGNYVNSTFNDLINLYLFDRELRLIIFNAIEVIEVAIKTIINNEMGRKYASHWFADAGNFRELKAVHDRPQEGESYERFVFAEFIAGLQTECTRHSKHKYIANYKRSYNEPELPPSWMIMEIISFGTISKMYEHLNDSEARTEIAEFFLLPKNILTSWLHALTNIRNVCAHHGKLIHTTFIIRPIFPTKRSRRFLDESDRVNTSSLYSYLCIIQRMLSFIPTDSAFKKQLLELLDKTTFINYANLGFTPNWRKEHLWS